METKSAVFSEDGKHRFILWRIWDESKPLVLFIGLNPSTADAETDDPTIRKVKNIAKNNGFGGVGMANLFTFISTDPNMLNIKEGNVDKSHSALTTAAADCHTIVFAWGNFQCYGKGYRS